MKIFKGFFSCKFYFENIYLHKKQMRFYKVGLLLIILSFTSCEQLADNYWDRKAEENYVSPYKGVYVGAYSGSDQGTLRIEISAKNYVQVKRVSTTNSFSETFEGGLIGPSFNKVQSRVSGFTVLGNILNTPPNSYSGSWKIDDANLGTWTLKKE